MTYTLSEMREKAEALAEKIGFKCKVMERLYDDYFGGQSYDLFVKDANLELDGKKLNCITLNSKAGWQAFYIPNGEKIIIPKPLSGDELEALLA